MPQKFNRASETKIARAVLRIAANCPDGIATYHRLRKEIPDIVKLNEGDLAVSDTRPNERMWEQIMRNIKSHHNAEGNFIAEGYLESVPRIGYRITEAGRLYLANKGG